MKNYFSNLFGSSYTEFEPLSVFKWETKEFKMWEVCPLCKGEDKNGARNDVCSVCNGKKIISKFDGKPPKD